MAQPSLHRGGLSATFLRDVLLTLGLLLGMTAAATAAEGWQRFVFLLFGALYTLWIGHLFVRLHRQRQRITAAESQTAADQPVLPHFATTSGTPDREMDEPLVSIPWEALPPADPDPEQVSPAIVHKEYTDDLLDTPEDREYLQKLVSDYLATLESQVLAIQQAVENSDYGRAETLTHRMKGSAAMYGLPEISEVAGLLESAITEHRDAELFENLLEMLQAATATVLTDGGKSHRESWDWSKM